MDRVRTSTSSPAPADPRKVLTAIGSTTYEWDLATDALAWGPNAAEVLGLPHIGIFLTEAAFTEAVEPGSGPNRAAVIRGAGALDPKAGSAFGTHSMLASNGASFDAENRSAFSARCDGETDQGAGVPYRIRYALRTKTDRLIMVEDAGRWYADAEGRPAFARGVLRAAPGAAGHDTMTAGLKARAALLARLVDDVVDAQRSRHPVTLVVGQIEPAEQEAGPDVDALVTEAARRIRPLMRRRDRFVPYGPARFALALASCEATEAESAVKRLLAQFDASPRFAGSLRLGAASAPDHAVDAPQLLRRAEEALALSARRGDRFAVYRAGPPTAPAPPRGTSAYDLVDALNARSLTFDLQPVRDARGNGLVFSEALPLLRKGERRRAAGDIRQAAEREGLAALVDGRMLELVADHLADRPDERIALTVSPATLADAEWLTLLAAHLGARPGIESRLIVQIPESSLVRARPIRGRLDAMKALGIATALVGFGAGHVSFKDLRGLPVDMLRIDGVFVDTLSCSTDARLFVRTLVDLGHHLGIAVAAEWVDDADTARLLAEWGVDYLQGGAIGAGMPAGSSAGPKQRLAGAAR